MGEKIKSLALTFVRGATGGLQGFIGAALTIISVCFLAGLFTGTTNIQTYFRNRNALGNTDAKIESLQGQLDAANLHIKLIQSHSPDFISEMALKYLNLGDPKMMILKR